MNSALNIVARTSIPAARRWRLGVRGKVVAILLATLFVIMTVNSLLALRAQEQDSLDESNRRGQATTHFIAQYLAYSVVSYDYHTLELILQDLTRSHDVLAARVENNRGNIMANIGTEPADHPAVRRHQAEIKLNGERLGMLRLSFSDEHTANVLAERRREALMGQLLAIALVMLTGFFALSAIVLKPLMLFSAVIRRNLQADANPLEPVPLASQDEIGDLAHGFNALQQSLDTTRQKLESRIDLANRELLSAYNRLEKQAEGLRESNRDLEQKSITDSLTGLYNQRYFEKVMMGEMAQSVHSDDTLSILLLDVDNLKLVNERQGHHAGDTMLRRVAQMIGSRVRLTDVACRFEGSTFFILCRRATISNAVAIADDMLHAMSQDSGGDEPSIALSIGVATIPGVHRVTSADEFFQQADDALRFCKQNGRNGVVHYSMLDRLSRTAMAT